jgi:NADH dehydrogenase [ubiquinone] 1 alpha subcomplex assembly factor 5
MNDTPDSQIFDRQTLRLRRDRAATGFAGFDFLKQEVAERLEDRLLGVNREFPVAVDLGSHTGALASILQRQSGMETVLRTDLSPAMAEQGHGQSVVADEEMLPLGHQSVNLVCSVLSLHWVNDLPGALVQINHALKPDGLFLAAMLGGDTLTELRQAFLQAEMAVLGGASPRVSPFVDVRDAGNLLQRAGFALPVADTEQITVDYSDVLSLMRDLRGMGESNVVRDRYKAPMTRRMLMAVAEAYHDQFARPDGRIEATFEIVYLTGWAPHESQQQPLKPGSATIKLEDALKMAKGDLQDPPKEH